MAAPYQPQLGTGGGSSFSGTESIGGPIANALEYGGELMDQEIHRRKELDRDMQASTAAVQLAAASSDIDRAAIDARANAGPAGAGHTQAIEQMVDTHAADALGQIRDPHVRALFQQHWANLKSNVATREYGWEAGQRVNYLTTNVQDATDLRASKQAANPDATALVDDLTATRDLWHSLAGVDDATREKGTKDGQRAIAKSFADGMAVNDPTYLVGDGKNPGLLQSPDFYKYLTSDDIKEVQSSADVELRRRDAAARQQANLAKAQTIESIDVLGKRLAQSDPTVTDAEIAAAAAGAKQYGLDGKLLDIADWKDLRDTNKLYSSAVPATITHDTNELAAKVANGTATEAEGLRLKHLQQVGPGLIQRFNSDPDAAAAAAGNPRPQIDWNNPTPADIQKNDSWARAFANSSGLVNKPYLPNDVAKHYQDLIKNGPAGQLAVTATLRAQHGGTIATEIVHQLAPGDKNLELMVGFHPRVAELYRKGVAALQAKTVHLGSLDPSTGPTDQQAVVDTFNAYAEAIPSDMQPAFRQAAESIAAGMAEEQGHHQPTGDDLMVAYRTAMQRAGGMLGSPQQGSATGGFANWEGHYVWLPQSMSRADFVNRMSRANGAAWVKAGGGEPYSMGSDGKLTKLSDSQVSQLAHYKLQTVMPGVFRLTSPIDGGHIVTKDGKPFQFDVRGLR